MKVLQIEQNSPEWLEARKCKITGSKLKDIIVKRGNTKKIGFYQLIADRLAITDGTVDGRDRGHNMESIALDAFADMTGFELNTDPGMWVSDINENIAISPDAYVIDGDTITEAVEVKCLGSARHIEAVLTDQIPSDYLDQGLQYFVVNQDLHMLYFVFYDPRVIAKPLHVIPMSREDYTDDIQERLDYQLNILQEIEKAVERLAF